METTCVDMTWILKAVPYCWYIQVPHCLPSISDKNKSELQLCVTQADYSSISVTPPY